MINEEIAKFIEEHGMRPASREYGIPRTTLRRDYRKYIENPQKATEKDDLKELKTILKYCKTDNQKLIIGALIKAKGNKTEVSNFLNMTRDNINRTIRTVKEYAGSSHTEQIAKYHDWDKSECIKSLKAVVEEYPTKVITRNFYRNETGVSDSTWSKHYGTFEEFKRQSNITPSRHVHQMERQIAKHASQDTLATLTQEKQSYEGKYEKPKGGRFKTIIKISDTHGKYLCEFFREVVLDTIKRIQPDIICHQGDAYDMAEFGMYTVDPREWDIVSDIKAGNNFFRDIRNAAPEAQIDFIESNHDWRLLRHLSDASPAMKAVLSDLHGFTFTSLLKIDEYEINYIGRSNLKAFSQRDIKKELAKNWKIYYDCSFVAHGHEKEMPKMHATIGHTHKYSVKYGHDHSRGAYGVYTLGYGATNGDEYTDSSKYQKGFMIETIDTHKKLVSSQYVDLSHGFCNVAGKYYTKG